MLLLTRLDHLETISKDRNEIVGRIASNRQTRTIFGSVLGKGTHDDGTARADSSVQYGQIGVTICLLHQEVEDRSIVPQIESPLWLPREYIGPQPIYGSSYCEPHTRGLQGGF